MQFHIYSQVYLTVRNNKQQYLIHFLLLSTGRKLFLPFYSLKNCCSHFKQCWKVKPNFYQSLITYALFLFRYHRTYSKKTGRWTVVQRKTQKTYSHVSEIMRKILQNRLESVGGMHQTAELSERDPRRISRTIAPKSPPPTTELVAKKKSRFEWTDILFWKAQVSYSVQNLCVVYRHCNKKCFKKS